MLELSRSTKLALVFITLGVPSLALVASMFGDAIMSCETNPWAGYTCPKWFAAIVWLGFIGAVTIIPFSICLIIVGLTSPKLWQRLRKARPQPKK